VNILMLDIGTRCGWAVADEDAPPLPMPPAAVYAAKDGAPALLPFSEAATLRALRHYQHGTWTDPTSYRGRYFQRFGEWLTRRIEIFEPRVLGIEVSVVGLLNMAAPKEDERGNWSRKTNPDTIRKLLGIVAVAEAVAAAQGVDLKEVNPSGMIKLAVGTGRDPGKAARKRRGKALGLPGDDNRLDAIYGLSWVLHDRQSARAAARAAA
jgi:hypothetical protein